MSTPVPAPRLINTSEHKKPIPTPRKLIPVVQENIDVKTGTSPKESESNMSTFSRRVRTLSSTSKQLTEEFAGKVQEKKKAVIEGTRQSVRRITRRFTTAGTENIAPVEIEDDSKKHTDDVDIFNTLSFQSPIRYNDQESIYSNMDVNCSDNELNSSNSSEDVVSLPPPLHPPPPLRDNSIYDHPQSLASESSHSSESSNVIIRNQYDYESVFPRSPNNSDSYVDMTVNSANKSVNLSRSDSWNYYDPVSKTEENIYNNIDNTPVLNVTCDLSPEIIDGNAENYNTHLEVRNTLYENHTVKPPPRTKKLNRKAAESVILQFDPLNNLNSDSYSNINDLKALEELLQGDLYGNLSNAGTYDNWSTSNESDIEEYINPPTPPLRFDSLPDETPDFQEKSKTSWFVNEMENKTETKEVKLEKKVEAIKPSGTKSNALESKATNWLKQVNDVLRKGPDIVKSNKQKDNMIPRPALTQRGAVHHRGMLYKITNGPVEDLFGEFSARWCVLENGTFVSYTDNSLDNVKESFSAEIILSVQILLDQKHKFKYENEDLHCLEINVSGKSRGGHTYGSKSISERRIWMQRLAECLTNRFNAKIISDYNRIGWAYIKEGVSGKWIGAWLVLSKRVLHYAVDNCSLKAIDLRKVKYIFLQDRQQNEFTPKTTEKGPNIIMHSLSGVLYLRMWTTRETKVWGHIIRLAAHNNGALLEQQQLTKHNIPVIVEKCINFIYLHGSMSEGIYRKAGSGPMVQDILTKFRKDAFAVQLTIDDYSEHDVATALKRFFRDLPEPLLTSHNRQYLCEVAQVKQIDEKIRMFKAVFDNFSQVAYKTVARLLGHLYFITTQSKQNLMTGDNLASVWSPTLMCCDDKDKSKFGQKESAVVAQLISLYKSIFPISADELEREKKMLQVLERCSKSPQGPINTKSSGDLRIWIHLYSKEGETVNIAIGPQKTAYEVCLELSTKIKLEVQELQLEELVLNDNLTRPIHHTEKVLDVVLRWSYWDEPDRKDNCLVLSKISKYYEYIQEKVLPMSGELKYADTKTKTFKAYMFEFAQAKLSFYKDKLCSIKLGSWNIEDILWYFGHESRRNPQSRWTLTFMLKKETPKRTKSVPYFGNIISFPSPSGHASWVAAMLKAEHPKDLIPPPQHVNLMSN